MIEFKEVRKSYKTKQVLKGINLTIADGEFMVLIGSSGCGKTTLLKTINKLISIDSGDVIINGVNVRELDETQLPKKIGYVVQEGGLFPHMTIEDNIALTMKLAEWPEDKIHDRVTEMLQLVNLDPEAYRNLYPSQLSGGQRQRVGVARAFASAPPIILMDEPFSALDPVTRSELQNEVSTLHENFHKTIVFVTHDMDEAIKLATRICVIHDGKIVQCDTPERLLKHPANDYVDSFIGRNRLWSNPNFIYAEDFMLQNPVQTHINRTVMQAIMQMSIYHVDSLLVTRGGKMAGMLRLSNIIHIEDYAQPIDAFITDDYITVFNDTSLEEIVSKVDYNQTGVIPVTDHDGYLKGFLTKGCLLATLSRQFTPEPEEKGSDSNG